MTQQTEDEQRICGSCNKLTKGVRCGGCKAIYYCDKQCQEVDWPIHKTRCRSKDFDLTEAIQVFCKNAWRACGSRMVFQRFSEDENIKNQKFRLKLCSGVLTHTQDLTNFNEGARVTKELYVKNMPSDHNMKISRNSFNGGKMQRSLRDWWQFHQAGKTSVYFTSVIRTIMRCWKLGKEVSLREEEEGEKETIVSFFTIVFKPGKKYKSLQLYVFEPNEKGTSGKYEKDLTVLEEHQVLILVTNRHQKWLVDLTPYQYEIECAYKDDNTNPYLIEKLQKIDPTQEMSIDDEELYPFYGEGTVISMVSNLFDKASTLTDVFSEELLHNPSFLLSDVATDILYSLPFHRNLSQFNPIHV
jgi:hypothetical protein